jgi:hypothetical protein
MRLNQQIKTLAVVAGLALAAGSANAAVVAYVGSQLNFESRTDDPAVGWRNATTTKTFDIDGDNIFGTDGYQTMGNSTASLPGYITSVAITAPNSNGGFVVLDNPANPLGADISNSGVWHDNNSFGSGYGSLFSITFGAVVPSDQTTRITMFFDTYNASGNQTYRVTQTVGGSGTAVSPTLIWATDGIDAASFDLSNVASGDVFIVESNSPAGFSHAGAVTFDSITIAAIPEPSSTALLGLGGLALLLRRRR